MERWETPLSATIRLGRFSLRERHVHRSLIYDLKNLYPETSCRGGGVERGEEEALDKLVGKHAKKC